MRALVFGSEWQRSIDRRTKTSTHHHPRATTAMSLLCNINGNNKITTTFPLSKLEEVPAWSAPAVARAPHSAGVSSASSASNRTVDRAEPCFITKASAYTHKQVHWVNTIRGKDPENGEWGVVSPYPIDLLIKD